MAELQSANQEPVRPREPETAPIPSEAAPTGVNESVKAPSPSSPSPTAAPSGAPPAPAPVARTERKSTTPAATTTDTAPSGASTTSPVIKKASPQPPEDVPVASPQPDVKENGVASEKPISDSAERESAQATPSAERHAIKQVNGQKNGAEEADVDSELSDPDSNVHSPPGVHDLADEIVVINRTDEDTAFSPNPVQSDYEDETMVDAQDEHVSPYPKRKRTSTVNGVNERNSEAINGSFEARTPDSVGGKVKSVKPGVKGVLLGHWRDSEVPDNDKKHAVIGFIDVRDRLRTRIQPFNLAGESMTSEYPLPPGPGGSWVTFDRIFFLPQLIGLDQSQVKEYVRVRSEMSEATEEERINAEKAVAKDVARRMKTNAPDHPSPQVQIAYGADAPDQLAAPTRPDAKRRKTSGGFAHIHPAPSPAQDSPRQSNARPALDTLPGTRPTRILLGYWNKSDEVDPKDRHAVYGILGHNDMFRVKLVRETRDGRYVDGNFPTAPGALWIAYEEVEMEPHLKRLARSEVKEYCRVRQYQIDQGESPEERESNESKAVVEAQARINGMPTTIRPRAASSAPTSAVPQDEPVSPTQRNNLNGQKLRTSRRTEAKIIAQAQAQAEQERTEQRDEPRTNGRSRLSMGDGDANSANRTQGRERALALAQREIARAEAAQGRADLHASHRERAAAVAADEATAAAAAAAAGPPASSARVAASEDMQRLNQIWARQESLRVKASSEDAKVYDGRKYERKSTGPFTGKLVAQGTLINIDGEDYVEYRVLTRPSFF